MRLDSHSVTALLLFAACGRLNFDANDGALPSTCRDAIQNGLETGIDCGGPCLDCPGATCTVDATCATDHCVDNACELATSPPFWIPGPSLSIARRNLQCATGPSGELIAIGGDNGVTTFASTEVLAAEATSSAPGPRLLAARSALAVVVAVDGTIYAFGGLDGGGTGLVSLEALIAGVWMPRNSNPNPHWGIAGAGGLDGKLFIVDNTGVLVYTPSSDSWSTGAATSEPRDRIGVARSADGQIYAVGGERTDAVVFDLVDSWDPETGVWTNRSPMQTARASPAAVFAADGRIYAIAGLTPSGVTTATVEAYTPDRDRWTDVAPLATPRSTHGAALGPDGRLYSVGGDNGAPLSSVEVYGPLMTLSPATAAANATVSVAGTNFAANAGVVITLDGAPIANGVTDDAGQLTTRFVVPALASGVHVVVGLDDKSQFPTTARLRVP